jgi:2-polyprenyl-6-methoxyphenol hydroxylase-like FAD-dependent oxidoreductase
MTAHQSTTSTVLVVGAGIGGLTAALALRRVGIDVTVFEQATALREVGAGISLWPNAVKSLRRLGVGDAVEQAGAHVEEMATRDRRGAVLHLSPASRLQGHFGAPLVMVHRQVLHAALVRALDQDVIRLDSGCVAAEQDDGGVRLGLADGRVATGQVLVGADGLRSMVRAFTLGDGPPRPRGLRSWRAVTTLAPSQAEPPYGEWWARGAVFGAQRLPGNDVYWYAATRARAGSPTPAGTDRAHLLDVFEAWQPAIPHLIQATAEERILRFDLFDRPAPRAMAFGRVALLGDAAHPMLPYLGQGACQAIEDGEALADALAGASDGVEAALRRYSRGRLRPASEAVVQSRRMSRVAHVRNPGAVALRRALLRRTSTEATLARLGPIVGGGQATSSSNAATRP